MIAHPTDIRPAPPLASGDMLTAAEFERRYHGMPDVKKAELIDGEVYMGSPVSARYHGSPHVLVASWLGVYWGSTRGVTPADNATVRLDSQNQPQPDAVLFIRPDHGGRVVMDGEGYLEGAPELIVEVAASSASIDLGKRLRAYCRNGVTEYVVWRVYDDAVDWFALHDGAYTPVPPDPADGLLKSRVFPGLWLDAAALLREDMAGVLAALTRGLASAERAAFVARLAARAVRPSP